MRSLIGIQLFLLAIPVAVSYANLCKHSNGSPDCLLSVINNRQTLEKNDNRSVIIDEQSRTQHIDSFNLTQRQSNVAKIEEIHHPSNVLQLGKNYFSPTQMKMVDIFFNKNVSQETLKDMRYIDYINELAGVKVVSQSSSDYFLHVYDTYQDMKGAAGPQVDQELCLRHLEHLNERAKANLKSGLRTEDLNFIQYIETFGGWQTGIPNGNSYWVGSYEACKGMKIAIPGNKKHLATRFCVTKLRSKDWPVRDQLDEILTVKTGICLPEVCDSIDYKNKYKLIKSLNEFHAGRRDLDNWYISGLYCLPDEQSEIRTWWRSTPTLITVSFTCLWIIALIVATIIDERNKIRCKQVDYNIVDMKQKCESNLDLICRSLSITRNMSLLFSTADKSTIFEGKHESTAKIVNLDMLDGIKVLAALYIISGHVLMLSTLLMNNGKELSTNRSVAWTISNLMPAFAVNIFFAITGILTTYHMFKQNQSRSFITSPSKWLVLMVYRYLRTAPMYAIVTLFCKHIARYIGDGPYWDYGTSSLAARRNCEQEPWAWTLLFGANFKSPLKHCIPSAWYLANDFQFFLVTPIFIIALYLRPKFGKKLLIGSTLASYIANIWIMLQSTQVDLASVGKFMPHGFQVYVNFLHESYTHPQYRIIAYLIGLYLGHMLVEYEQDKEKEVEEQKKNDSAPEQEITQNDIWSLLIKYGPWFSLFVVITVFMTPSITSRLPIEDSDKVRYILSVTMPSIHVIYSTAIGIYILLATTGQGCKNIDRFLSLNFWKPLARMSLCVMLVNVEVITYLTQTSRTPMYMDNYYMTSLNVMTFICTYIVSTIVCVLFEAPARKVLNYVLTYLMNQTANKKKVA